MTVSGAAQLAGVIGWPVRHSLSPRLHGYWLGRYGIDGLYLPLEIAPDDLADALRFMARAGFRGANLTVPHKEAALSHVDAWDEAVEATGAANTLWREDGRWHATNTDVYGFQTHLAATCGAQAFAGRRAVVLGAGGAARAVVLALSRLGVAEIHLINRDRARAEALMSRFPAVTATGGWEAAAAALAGAALVVNTTTLGMHGQPDMPLTLDALPVGAVVADIVYAPLETPLLAQARARGLATVDGLGMLLHQAVDGFARWFGVRPEVDDATRAHLIAGLSC